MIDPDDDELAPPARDPWDEYALDKIRAQLADDEFYFEDANGSFSVWGIAALVAFGICLARIAMSDSPSSLWDAATVVVTLALAFSCLVLRIHGAILLKRVRRRQKWIERHGLKYL
ncbi:hypothetical protein [Mesorhizobium sp. Z1-4]|uniref:hypothetical protein n=1 Tax=Mesorhizobium sp. Z1-4 TaxID=2448478 RepID=UPI000FD865C8|nr:hypothetical protein [Mesorhizobium sp. Z1-4]